MNTETPEIRLKRLRMRSIRRGIKEMDLILTAFSEDLGRLSTAQLGAYESLLSENDQDLYLWVSGQQNAPAEHSEMIEIIRKRTVSGVT